MMQEGYVTGTELTNERIQILSIQGYSYTIMLPKLNIIFLTNLTDILTLYMETNIGIIIGMSHNPLFLNKICPHIRGSAALFPKRQPE